MNEKVLLVVSCENLSCRDIGSKSDPRVVLYEGNVLGKDNIEYVKVDQTETISNNHSPQFAKHLEVDYAFEMRQPMLIRVYDCDNETETMLDDDHLGEHRFDLSAVMAANNCTLTLELQGKHAGKGSVTLQAIQSNLRLNDAVTLNIVGVKLDKKDFFSGLSDPYYVLKRLDPPRSGTGAPVVHQLYKSETIPKNLDPHWRVVVRPMGALFTNDNASLVLEVWDEDVIKKDKLIGACTFKGKELLGFSKTTRRRLWKDKDGKDPKAKDRGHVDIKVSVEPKPSFLDYIRGGQQLNLCVSVDFTGSNGLPTTAASLHYMGDPSRPNEYVQAIRNVGAVLEPYSFHRLHYGFGFGGELKRRTSHFFPLGSNPLHGIDGVLAAYTNMLSKVTLSNPTNFADTIKGVTALAKEQHGSYTVLMIITDGEISDMQETVRALGQARDAPLSVVIVGVGSVCDYKGMAALDGDDEPPSPTGKPHRDIVQFVPFAKYGHNPVALSSMVLKEIPRQFLQWASAIRHRVHPMGTVIPPPPIAALTKAALQAGSSVAELLNFLRHHHATVQHIAPYIASTLINLIERGETEAAIVSLLQSMQGMDVGDIRYDGNSALHFAAQRGLSQVVHQLLLQGANALEANKDNMTPLLVALKQEQTSCGIALCSAIQGRSLAGQPYMVIAASLGDPNLLQVLHDNGADVNYISPADAHQKVDMSPMMAAARVADLGAMECLKKWGAKVDNPNTPILPSAIKSGSVDAAKLVLSWGVPRLTADSKGAMAFAAACSHCAANGGLAMLEHVLDGTNVGWKDVSDRRVSFGAASNADPRVMECILNKADKTLRKSLASDVDKTKKSPLHVVASTTGSVAVAGLLHKAGCALNSPDDSGNTPIELALQKQHFDLVEALVKWGVDIANQKPSPLIVALEAKNVPLAQRMLQFGCPATAKGSGDKTALHFAAELGDAALIELLHAKGAKLNAEDSTGHTPFEVAVARKMYNAIEALVKLGVDVNKQKPPPLIEALKTHDNTLIQTMIKLGCDVNVKDPSSKRSPFHFALEMGDIELLKQLHAKGAKPNVETVDGETPIEVALRKGLVDVVELLVQWGVDLKKQDPSPLITALKTKNHGMIQLMLKLGCDVNVKDHGSHRTPAHFATEMNDVDLLCQLHKKGAKLNVEDSKGQTPVEIAIERRNCDLIQVLVDNGVDLKKQEPSPLITALRLKDDRMIDLMLRVGCPATAREPGTKRTAMHFAAETGNVALLVTLHDRGAKVDAESDDGKTPLEVALHHKRLDVIEKLVEWGVNVNKQTPSPLIAAMKQHDLALTQLMLRLGCNVAVSDDSTHNTPAHYAIEMDNVDLLHTLHAKGAKLNKENSLGQTPFEIAFSKHQYDVVELLVQWGVDVNKQDPSPLSLAIEKKDAKMVQLMLKLNCNVNFKDKRGKMPIHYALERHNIDVMTQLHAKGAKLDVADATGNTPIEIAMTKRQYDAVDALVGWGVSVMKQSPHPLVLATRLQDHKLAAQVLNLSIKEKGDRACKVLSPKDNVQVAENALHYCSPDFLTKLQVAGINFAAIEDDGHAAREAAKGGNAAAITWLHDHELLPAYDAAVALVVAIERNKAPVVSQLLKHGASPDAMDKKKCPALCIATQRQYRDIVRALLDAGVNRLAKNADGLNAIQLAAILDNAELTSMLTKPLR